MTLVVCTFLGAPARADDSAQSPRWWAEGPAGGAFGVFVEGGASVGQIGFAPFAAGSLGVGASLRWFEASVTGYYGSSFDSVFAGGAFLARLALRVPVSYVAFSVGPALGYLEVPGHYVSGFAFEPLAVGVEIDPVCHLRLGLLGTWTQIFGDSPEGGFRGAITVGYVMGHCRQAGVRTSG